MALVRQTQSKPSPATLKRMKALKAMPDKDIDYSDIPELDEEFWGHAKVMYPPPPKTPIQLRVDNDVLKWFKKKGRGYQTHMNAVLRAYTAAIQHTKK